MIEFVIGLYTDSVWKVAESRDRVDKGFQKGMITR